MQIVILFCKLRISFCGSSSRRGSHCTLLLAEAITRTDEPSARPSSFTLAFGRRPAETLIRWKEKYGDTFTLRMAGQFFVVLNDIATARKLFQDDNVTGRDEYSLIRTENGPIPPGAGLVMSNHELWKTHRRFALSTLRDLGMGKNWLEDTIIAEVEALCQVLRETQRKPFNPKVKLTNSVSNVICALIFGQRFELDDPRFTRLTAMIAEDIASSSEEVLVKTLPFLMRFPNGRRSMIIRGRRNRESLIAFMREMIAGAEGSKDHYDVQDYLHAYQRERETGAKMADKATFDDIQLVASMLDLFGAGTETTSTTLLWAFLLILESPDVQRKIQDEIDNNVGREKLLSNSDRGRKVSSPMPSNLIPIGGRVNHEEVTVDGYTIPKNTSIILNLFSVHRDPRYWKNPEQFDPTRFLDKNKKLIKPEGFAPFSVGKRACLGEALAKMELFLFAANLLRCFTLELPPGKTISHQDYVSGVVHAPFPFELIFIPQI
ncbi:Cytochrome P450 18a1 [Hypsibius exemplaris]|uniref:Cytochrome P450 18a1 n=1 Tax=Hypsibius exemplaris TaxID=2072580 RepID=A0A1W0WCB6_HYPEX|nr:Cytochrome P450 18a1 [Hypsibius exemplaris]